MLGNTFGNTTTTYGASKSIWHEPVACYPIGGTIEDLSGYAKGDVIPAGSMCILDQSAHTIEIVKASDTAKLASVNGLLYNDIYVDVDPTVSTNNANATGAVVYSGEIYIDRCAETIPSTVLANLPMIVAVKEA